MALLKHQVVGDMFLCALTSIFLMGSNEHLYICSRMVTFFDPIKVFFNEIPHTSTFLNSISCSILHIRECIIKGGVLKVMSENEISFNTMKWRFVSGQQLIQYT